MTMTCQCPQLTEQGSADCGCNTGAGSDHYAHGFRSIASTVLNDEGTFGNRNAKRHRPPPCGMSVIVIMKLGPQDHATACVAPFYLIRFVANLPKLAAAHRSETDCRRVSATMSGTIASYRSIVFAPPRSRSAFQYGAKPPGK